ncbi:hypothetical protein [Lutibacter sp.]
MKKLIIIVLLFVFKVSAQESNINGSWKLSKVIENGITQTGFKAVFVFAEKGVLKSARSISSANVVVGTWKYNSKGKTIKMSSDLDQDFNGEAKIIKLNKNILVYEKDGVILSFTKLKPTNLSPKIKPVTTTMPILSFKEEEMLDEEGSFNYEDEEKLPWKIEAIVSNLKNYKDIIYTVTHFSKNYEPNSFLVSSKINFNKEEKTIDVREYSFTQNDYIDMTEDPILLNNIQEYEYDFNFFPEDNLIVYKVIGVENIKTVLGNLTCTIVEGFNEYDYKIKYWMINDMPGVFAKIIKVKEAPAPFNYTNLYILKEIK